MGEIVEVVFEPVDNARLANLCGALDENLRQIESAFDVGIVRRGGRVHDAMMRWRRVSNMAMTGPKLRAAIR